MVVWRITGEDVSEHGGAAYFETKREAKAAQREHRALRPGRACDGPDKIEIKGRRDLAFWLNEAVGYGAS